VPEGYVVAYVLTEGAELVIQALGGTPSFDGLTSGSYTIHTLVYPDGLDLSFVEVGVTTGFDVNALLAQGGGTLCAALDVAGAPFFITLCDDVLGCTDPDACNFNEEATFDDGTCEYLSCCEAEAGTLEVVFTTCVEAGGGAVGAHIVSPIVPVGYELAYVLTEGAELVIQGLGGAPSFDGLMAGSYTIHTFVYPEGLDLSFVEVGVTTGFDVNALLAQGGGTLCAALDVPGAPFTIEACEVIEGCTDEAACNYNPEATEDDGSCTFPGDACDDGDPNTENDTLNDQCECVGTPIEQFDCPDLEANIGDACDDGDPNTTDDVITEDCECIGTTGINEHFMSSVKVFPNPVSHELTIDLGERFEPVMATLTDLSGRVVMSEQMIGRATLSVDHLATGMYVLMLETTDARGEVKVIVTR
jgi:hypothetical protein